MNRDPAEQLARSWNANAAAWTDAVRHGTIPSRRLATDAAIVQALLNRHPRRVLDLGCGEGWLVRALAKRGIEMVGVDASAPLIERARAGGGSTFHHCSYAELAHLPGWLDYQFDAIVCNFALLEHDVSGLLQRLRERLTVGAKQNSEEPAGALVVQTVHPWTARGDGPYCDGWRTETFSGFGGDFVEPMPWYFRTLSSWVDLLQRSGYCVQRISEPLHPQTGAPLSLLIEAISAD